MTAPGGAGLTRKASPGMSPAGRNARMLCAARVL